MNESSDSTLAIVFLAALAPFAWSRPFLVCALFIAFSYFRLAEAYPFLAAAKPALALGATAMTVVVVRVLGSADREGVEDTGQLRALCLALLLLTVAVAYSFSALRPDGEFAGDVIAIPIVMVLAILCVVAWGRLLSATGIAPLPVNVRIFIAYFAVISFVSVFSAIPAATFSQWMGTTWKIAAMTLAIAWLARSDRDFSLASRVVIAAGVLVAAVAIYNSVNGIGLVEGTRVTIGRDLVDPLTGVSPRPQTNILADPNDLALILLFPFALAAGHVMHRKSLFHACIWTTLAGIILLAIVATQSRGALIGVLAAIATILIMGARTKAPTLIALVVAAPLLFVTMQLGERQSGGLTEVSERGIDESAEGRLEAWHTALKMVAARPLTGVGIGNFGSMYMVYTDYWQKKDMAVHSMWFEVLAECGVVAFILFVGMVAVSFSMNARTLRFLASQQASTSARATSLGLQGALAGTCAAGSFLSQAHTWPVFMTVALIAALSSFVGAESETLLSSAPLPLSLERIPAYDPDHQ